MNKFNVEQVKGIELSNTPLTEEELKDIEFRIESMTDASSCVKHRMFEDPFAGCPACWDEDVKKKSSLTDEDFFI